MNATYLRAMMGSLAAFILTSCSKAPEPAAPPAPPVVLVTTATQDNVPIFSEAIATMDGYVNAQIHSQVSGYLIKQAYQEGSTVKQGDLLFLIDPKPFQADLDKAKADLANKQAIFLASKQDLARYSALVKSGAVSQQEYQNQVQNNLAAQANVDAAQASVTTAEINLGYTRITSPIDGVAGRAIPGVGDLISPSTTLTTISTVDPIQAEFSLPEQFFMNNAERIAKITAMPIAERPESLQLVLPDGSTYPYKGRFYYLNRQIQTSTGAMTAYGLFPNPAGLLRPGQYAKVRGITQQIDNAVLIPQICVNQVQGSNQVFVVKPDNTIEVRSVTLGDQAGPLWIVNSGLQPGERVVAEGIQKCQPGLTVDPQPYQLPADALPQEPSAEPPASPSTNAAPAQAPAPTGT
jgi:membrane fusion protein (multidrug efflux system)